MEKDYHLRRRPVCLKARHLVSVLALLLLCLPQRAQADPINIYTQTAWDNFVKSYDGAETVLNLYCDIAIEGYGITIDYFKGTIDGHGHSIKLNLSAYKDSAPFEDFEGTIRNLKFTGNIKYYQAAYGSCQSSALVRDLEHNMTIENCLCDVAYNDVGTAGTTTNSNNMGGFIAHVDNDVTVTFKNCAFTGSFTAEKQERHVFSYTGGFVGELDSDATLNLYNCLSYIWTDDDVTARGFDLRYFVGMPHSGANIKMSNVYGCSNKELINKIGATVITPDQINSGEVTYTLNNGNTPDGYWAQTLGTDTLPMLHTFSADSKYVYKEEQTTRLGTLDQWATLFYPADVTLPDGVKKYKVTGVGDEAVNMTEYSGSTANVPLLLYCESGMPDITLPVTDYYNHIYQDTKLRGSYGKTCTTGDYSLSASEQKFVQAVSDVPAWQCYIADGKGDGYALGKDESVSVRISSADDWNNMVKTYGSSGKRLKVTLSTDLTIRPNETRMSIFNGTIDGQGHTITVDNSSATLVYKSAIATARGTFKNLIIKGKTAKDIFIQEQNGELQFQDCLFETTPVEAVTYNIVFKNCLSNVSSTAQPEWWQGAGYNSNCVLSNCYQLTANKHSVATYADAATAASGEVAYKLNAGRAGSNAVWKQTIGTDAVPQLLSSTSKEVFHQEASTRTASSDKWSTFFYPADVTLPKGVLIYTEKELANDTLYTERVIGTTIKAYTPAIIYCKDGIPAISLPATAYYNESAPTSALAGAYKAVTATSRTRRLATVDDKPQFGEAGVQASQWHCYLNASDYDTYKVGIGRCVITSKAEWLTFCENYDGSETEVYLGCDLTLTKDDVALESFKGTLDGQGHSIIYDFVTSDNIDKDQRHNGFIYKATGTIKNLNITGQIYVAAYISYPVSYPAPLAFLTNGTEGAPDELNIENCHSDVSYYVSERNDYTGAGFLIAPTYATVNFKDCSFTGTFASPVHRVAGGFVAQQWQPVKVNIENCYSDVHIPSTSVIETEPIAEEYSPKSVGYFVGKQRNSSNITLTNCYAHNSSTLSFGTTMDGQNIVTDDQLKNGEVALSLKNGRTGDDNPWGETLGTDSEPKLITFSPDSKEVFYAAEGTKDFGESTWATFYYPAEVKMPETLSVYKVTGVEDGTMTLVDIFQQENKGTPLLLHSEDGIGSISLPALYYNRSEHTGTLRPVYETTTSASGWNLLQLADGQPQFAQPAASTEVPEWTCYSVAPATARALGEIIIKSKADWTAFKANYNDQEVKARLACDLELGDDDAGMQSFRGTFDGGGHKLTISYTSAGDDKLNAPFMSAAGTIKNLNIEGEIKWDGDVTGYCYVAPLVNRLMTKNLELTIDNCHSNVTYTATTDYQKASSGNRAGGFIRIVGDSGDPYDITVHFIDCSAVVKLKDISSMFNYGGFIGLLYRRNTATFDNCYADLSDNAISTIKASTYECDYFAVPSSNKAILTVTNCYARKATYAKTEFKNYGNVTIVTDDQVASGEVAYKLNAGRTGDDIVWAQTIGTDEEPMAKIQSADSREVFLATDTVKIGAAGWATHYYPLAKALPEGVKAYTVSGAEKASEDAGSSDYVITLEDVTGEIPAYTPVLLCTLGEGQTEASQTITIEMPDLYYNELKETDIEDNGQAFQLIGVTRDTETFDGCYVLQRHTDAATGKKKTAFYRVDTSVATPVVPAWKCVLVYTGEASEGDANAVHLRLDGEATGINGAAVLDPLLSEGQTYDLDGRPVKTLQKGQVYIKNGQKFVIK